jgi:hypothetical protein
MSSFFFFGGGGQFILWWVIRFSWVNFSELSVTLQWSLGRVVKKSHRLGGRRFEQATKIHQTFSVHLCSSSNTAKGFLPPCLCTCRTVPKPPFMWRAFSLPSGLYSNTSCHQRGLQLLPPAPLHLKMLFSSSQLLFPPDMFCLSICLLYAFPNSMQSLRAKILFGIWTSV